MNVKTYLIAAIVAVAMTTAVQAKAEDGTYSAFGIGLQTCQFSLIQKHQQEQDVIYSQAIGWIEGYWSALNLSGIPQGHGHVGSKLPPAAPLGAVFDMVADECARNTASGYDETLADATRKAWLATATQGK
jgi:hypothetical protein